MTGSAAAMAASTARAMLLPLVLAQFLCSFAASSLNVAISSIATDLGHDRQRRPDGHHRSSRSRWPP